MTSALKRVPPTWRIPGTSPSIDSPVSAFRGLYVYNSLSNTKVPFIPRGPTVSFYICGPTVYDSAHFGHARNYVTFDILRRILEDYFRYPVFSIMNITDIDDKIIIGARKHHLLNQYLAAHPTVTREVFDTLLDAALKFAQNLRNKVSKLSVNPTDVEYLYFKEKLAEADADYSSLSGGIDEFLGRHIVDVLSPIRNDALASYLDKRDGHTCTDQAMFRAHAARFEREFMSDMKDLGVRPPDALTRVTEYIPEIQAMIDKIKENGLAYEAGGSVYFDTRAFDAKPGNFYAKLRPNSVNNTELLNEGEGSLTTTHFANTNANSNTNNTKITGEDVKRHPSDFALWKRSKPGEPSWAYPPLPPGRPGWHIECSAMATSLAGPHLDMHCGGVDLAFPHHDNEIAQTEAAFNSNHWVDYFLHAGHLAIDGLKMSKSLKNFKTIAEVRATSSSRQVRLYFLGVQWEAGVDWNKEGMSGVLEKERRLVEFLRVVENLGKYAAEEGEGWRTGEKDLMEKVEKAKSEVHAALCDNFNTPQAVERLLGMVKHTHAYISHFTKEGNKNANKNAGEIAQGKEGGVRVFLVVGIARYIARMFSVFGVDFPEAPSFSAAACLAEKSTNQDDNTIQILAEFRRDVRDAAKRGGNVLEICDKLRDEIMPKNGVRIQDDGQTLWVRASREELERDEREKAAAKREKLEKRLGFLDREVKWRKEAKEAVVEKPVAVEGVSKSAVKKMEKVYELAVKKKEKFEKEGGEEKLKEMEEEFEKLKAELSK